MENKKGCECKEHYNKTNKERDGGIVSVRMVAINEKGEKMGKKKPTAKQILEYGAGEIVYHVMDKNGKITELGRFKIDKENNKLLTFKSE
jgi:pyrimidine deaminase RibD-like protein